MNAPISIALLDPEHIVGAILKRLPANCGPVYCFHLIWSINVQVYTRIGRALGVAILAGMACLEVENLTGIIDADSPINGVLPRYISDSGNLSGSVKDRYCAFTRFRYVPLSWEPGRFTWRMEIYFKSLAPEQIPKNPRP